MRDRVLEEVFRESMSPERSNPRLEAMQPARDNSQSRWSRQLAERKPQLKTIYFDGRLRLT